MMRVVGKKRGESMIFKKWWDAFLELKRTNLPRFILLCARVGLGFLFFVAMLLPFFKMIQFGSVVARTASVQIPGGWIFLILTWILMAGIAFASLLKEGWLKWMLLGQAAQMSILWLWDMVIFAFAAQEALNYPEASCALAFGMVFELIVLGLMWVSVFGEKFVLAFLGKRAKVHPAAEAEAAAPPQA